MRPARRGDRLRHEMEHRPASARQGCRVTVLPGTFTAEEVLAMKPDGVFLSNGPGDPEPLDYAIETIRGLLGKTPVFGICLGHQLLSLACGAEDIQAEIRPSRRQPAGAESAKPARSRSRPRTTALPWTKTIAAGDARSDAPQFERRHDRRRAASRAAGLQRAVPSRSFGRPARQPLPVPPISRDAVTRRTIATSRRPRPWPRPGCAARRRSTSRATRRVA